MHDRDDHGPDDQSDDGGHRGVDQPGQQAADALHGVMHELLGVMDEAVRRVPADVVGSDEQDVAADPEHRDRADGRQRRQQLGHRGDQTAADLLRERVMLRCARLNPMSSIFTIRATTPYTAAVMTKATTTRMMKRGQNDWSATSLSAITMISADRMKSVRIAPEVICFSASSPTVAVGAAWASWPACPGNQPTTFSAPS